MQLSELAEASQCVKLPGSVPTDYFSTRYGTSEKAQGDIPLMKLSQLHVLSKLEKMEDCGFHHSNSNQRSENSKPEKNSENSWVPCHLQIPLAKQLQISSIDGKVPMFNGNAMNFYNWGNLPR